MNTNELQFMKRIKKLSETESNIIPLNLKEFGNEQEVIAICQKLGESGFIKCTKIDSNRKNNNCKWLDIRNIELTPASIEIVSNS